MLQRTGIALVQRGQNEKDFILPVLALLSFSPVVKKMNTKVGKNMGINYLRTSQFQVPPLTMLLLLLARAISTR